MIVPVEASMSQPRPFTKAVRLSPGGRRSVSNGQSINKICPTLQVQVRSQPRRTNAREGSLYRTDRDLANGVFEANNFDCVVVP